MDISAGADTEADDEFSCSVRGNLGHQNTYRCPDPVAKWSSAFDKRHIKASDPKVIIDHFQKLSDDSSYSQPEGAQGRGELDMRLGAEGYRRAYGSGYGNKAWE